MSFRNMKPLCFNLHSNIEIPPALVWRLSNAAYKVDVSLVVDIPDAGVPTEPK